MFSLLLSGSLIALSPPSPIEELPPSSTTSIDPQIAQLANTPDPPDPVATSTWEFEVENDLEQLTSVSQLTDVQPADWAFHID